MRSRRPPTLWQRARLRLNSGGRVAAPVLDFIARHHPATPAAASPPPPPPLPPLAALNRPARSSVLSLAPVCGSLRFLFLPLPFAPGCPNLRQEEKFPLRIRLCPAFYIYALKVKLTRATMTEKKLPLLRPQGQDRSSPPSDISDGTRARVEGELETCVTNVEWRAGIY